MISAKSGFCCNLVAYFENLVGLEQEGSNGIGSFTAMGGSWASCFHSKGVV